MTQIDSDLTQKIATAENGGMTKTSQQEEIAKASAILAAHTAAAVFRTPVSQSVDTSGSTRIDKGMSAAQNYNQLTDAASNTIGPISNMVGGQSIRSQTSALLFNAAKGDERSDFTVSSTKKEQSSEDKPQLSSTKVATKTSSAVEEAPLLAAQKDSPEESPQGSKISKGSIDKLDLSDPKSSVSISNSPLDNTALEAKKEEISRKSKLTETQKEAQRLQDEEARFRQTSLAKTIDASILTMSSGVTVTDKKAAVADKQETLVESKASSKQDINARQAADQTLQTVLQEGKLGDTNISALVIGPPLPLVENINDVRRMIARQNA